MIDSETLLVTVKCFQKGDVIFERLRVEIFDGVDRQKAVTNLNSKLGLGFAPQLLLPLKFLET